MNPNLPPMHRLRVRALPDDMVLRVLDQLVEGTPPEDLCGRLYERCLLLLGSGQCPPDHPVWAQACRRFGVMQKGVGLETWQATFRAFCKEIARLTPNFRAVVWKYVRGDGASVPHENFEALLRYVDLLRETGSLDDVLPVVYGALKHFGLFDPEAREVIRLWNGSDPDENVQKILQLIDGHPRGGVRVLVTAIRFPHQDPVARRLIPALLAAGVPTETLYRDGETLLHFAVRMRNAYAVAQLLQAGADQTARNAEGWTAAEMAKQRFVYRLKHEVHTEALWVNDEWHFNTATEEILELLWPEAMAEWRAMSEAERRAAVRDGWSPARA